MSVLVQIHRNAPADTPSMPVRSDGCTAIVSRVSSPDARPIVARAHRHKMALVATAACGLVIATAVAMPPIQSAAGASSASMVPAPRALPQALDAQAQYEGQTLCSPVTRPGIKALRALLLVTYGPHPSGTTRSCNEGRTEHADGRALDWMVSVRNPVEAQQATTFLTWLVGPDAAGVPAGNARRMGIMYLGWNNRMWRGYGKVGWGELRGCLAKSKAKPFFDTDCHRNHIHFSMTWDGAAARTSYWSGSPVARTTCPSTSTRGPSPIVAGPIQQVAVPATAIVRTATGLGAGGRSCRLNQRSGPLVVKVAGRGNVPSLGVQSVLLLITPVAPNAPTRISAWPAGGAKPRAPIAIAPQNQTVTTLASVKLGANGSIAFATDTGSTDLRVEVVGYLRGASR